MDPETTYSTTRNKYPPTTVRQRTSQNKESPTRVASSKGNGKQVSTMILSENGSIEPSSAKIDIENRIACKFHPNKTLQAFCLSPDCMLPLCSSCIWQHSQEHQEQVPHEIG